MVINTHEEANHYGDLEGILKSFRKYNIHSNPTKCSFGVHAGEFLGFMLIKRWIEANPDKFHAMINIRSPIIV